MCSGNFLIECVSSGLLLCFINASIVSRRVLAKRLLWYLVPLDCWL
uniref:Uncharacterized protein n=1 Tax=Rhizophora mucronata TaxID=61149 RepID=A0A2P2IJV5_RHIMU